MSNIPDLHQFGTEEQYQGTNVNLKLCIICQSQRHFGEKIVKHPGLDSYQKILDTVKERSELNDHNYVKIQMRLKYMTKETLSKHNAFWHRNCYSQTVHKDHIQRARDRNVLSIEPCPTGKRGIKRKNTAIDEPGPSARSLPFTRSCTQPLNTDKCFFCQEDAEERLFKVCTENAGQQLKSAVDKSDDLILKTRLNACISPTDAHAIDIRYHKSCWRKQVFHVTRDRGSTENTSNVIVNPFQNASLIELINMIDVKTKKHAHLSMDDIETMYMNLLGSNGIEKHFPAYKRAWLKEKILTGLPHVQAYQSNRRKAFFLYSPTAFSGDTAKSSDSLDDMTTIFKAAQILRKVIADFKKVEHVNVIPVSSDTNDVPSELYTMIRWILLGTVDELKTKKTALIDRLSLTISQNILFGFKSNRQVKYKGSIDSTIFRPRLTRENPQVLGLALTVHHDTRNKQLLNLLNAQGYCVSHLRTLKLETALANAVVENTKRFRGLYVPPFLKKGTFVYFAADNVDFSEDTTDGKGTTHGTIVAVYQRADASGEPVAPPLTVHETKNLSVTPYHLPMMHCDKPKPKLVKRKKHFTVNKDGISNIYKLTHLGWIIASTISRLEKNENVPGWAGYNSLLSRNQPITQIGALPLLPEVAHEWPTLLTVITQTTQLRRLVVGEEHPTVLSLGMALYEKVVQLLDARPDMKNMVVPRLGELHAVMAALRALGTSVENSGIDDAWIEADVYGPATTRQILKCTHYKRSLRAHIYSYVALYELVLEEFFKEYPQQKRMCLKATGQVLSNCSVKDKTRKAESAKQANNALIEDLNDLQFVEAFECWQACRAKNAMFRSIMNYLHRVESILFFVAASRSADLILHMQAAEELSKLFFTFDRIKYMRLWPRYIADMQELRTKHPQTWKELEEGNLSVSRSNISFVSIGADHACEHINRQLKMHGGLIGISNNANARQRFFMAAPELSCLSRVFKNQFGVGSSANKSDHPELSSCAISKDKEAIDKIKCVILRHDNPITADGDRLYNMITHAYIPQEYVSQILNADDTGQKLYEKYIAERINGGTSFWAPIKRGQNRMFMSDNKKSIIKIRDKTVDLKETKDLYGRLMVLTRSKRIVDQKHAIGNYEFTQPPRVLFAPNGDILPCTDKFKVIHFLEKLIKGGYQNKEERSAEGQIDFRTMSSSSHSRLARKVALVDGMVLVHKLTRTIATVSTIKNFSELFYKRLSALTEGYDEVILVFDTYKADSLKRMTRDRRRYEKYTTQYDIKDETIIKNIPMSRLLSHDQTKADLSEYLAAKTVEYSKDCPKLIIASAGGRTEHNRQLIFDANNHEEADTLLIHQAVLASRRNPSNSEFMFFSPDTDVLVLVVANYHLLLQKTYVSLASGIFEVEPIWTNLGAERAKSLPAFHAFTGSDNTGRFSRIGKATWLNVYLQTDDTFLEALRLLSQTSPVTDELQSTLAKLVCIPYSSKGVQIDDIPELRWHLFCKNLAESDKLPPTIGALKQHVLRAHVQASVWGQADIAEQEFIDPLLNGYYKDKDGMLKPITTESLPAPEAIIEMVRCRCKKDCSSRRCSCKSNDLTCTELCLCNTECQNDEDSHDIAYASDSDSDGENNGDL